MTLLLPNILQLKPSLSSNGVEKLQQVDEEVSESPSLKAAHRETETELKPSDSAVGMEEKDEDEVQPKPKVVPILLLFTPSLKLRQV